MAASLPQDIQVVFTRFITTEYTTVDAHGQPITWPVTPYYTPGASHIDVTTGLGYPKKADDARRNPRVSLLFSDPTGSGLTDAPTVLVQGIAEVDDRDLECNRERYERESGVKLPGTRELQPPRFLKKLFAFYYLRIYVHVWPKRIVVWPLGDMSHEPSVTEVSGQDWPSGIVDQPQVSPELPGRRPIWDQRMDELSTMYRTAVLSLVSPDGFPFSVRLPVTADRERRRVRIDTETAGAPLLRGPACLTAHDHDPTFRWWRTFQVRGQLVEDDSGWSLVPHRCRGGLEVPPTSKLQQYRGNFRNILRLRRTAQRELKRRATTRS